MNAIEEWNLLSDELTHELKKVDMNIDNIVKEDKEKYYIYLNQLVSLYEKVYEWYNKIDKEIQYSISFSLKTNKKEFDKNLIKRKIDNYRKQIIYYHTSYFIYFIYSK